MVASRGPDSLADYELLEMLLPVLAMLALVQLWLGNRNGLDTGRSGTPEKS